MTGSWSIGSFIRRTREIAETFNASCVDLLYPGNLMNRFFRQFSFFSFLFFLLFFGVEIIKAFSVRQYIVRVLHVARVVSFTRAISWK